MRLLPSEYSTSPARTRRGGTAIVEFALVVPFLCLILMGMFELGRAMMVKTTLSDAVRKGCRTGIKRDKGNSDITAQVIDVMKDNGFDTSKFNPPTLGSISITVIDPSGKVLTDSLDAPSGSSVSVQASIPVSSTTWVTPFYLGSGTALESETIVMM